MDTAQLEALCGQPFSLPNSQLSLLVNALLVRERKEFDTSGRHSTSSRRLSKSERTGASCALPGSNSLMILDDVGASPMESSSIRRAVADWSSRLSIVIQQTPGSSYGVCTSPFSSGSILERLSPAANGLSGSILQPPFRKRTCLQTILSAFRARS